MKFAPLSLAVLILPFSALAGSDCNQALTARAPLPEKIQNPYEYADYQGPENAVLKEFLDQPISARNPRVANAAQHGKVFETEEVFNAVWINISAKEPFDIQRFIDVADRMRGATPRARIFKSSFSRSHIRSTQWIFRQYPELKNLRETWEKAAGDQVNVVGGTAQEVVTQWLNQHPEYKNGLLIFPRPSLWNRVAQKDEYLSIKTGSEFFIEDIAAILHSGMTEPHFDRAQKTLLYLAGPHGNRLSQINTLKTIARWILHQYPELTELAQSTEIDIDIDALSDRFGRTLGLFPIEWATGDFRQFVETDQLPPLPEHWVQKTLPQLTSFLRGESSPRLARKRFELKDPDTGKRRELRTGDYVELAFRPRGDLQGDLTYLDQYSVSGRIEKRVIDQGKLVGIQLRHWEYENDYAIRSKRSHLAERIDTYWLADFHAEDSIIDSSSPVADQTVDFSSLKFPENSGELTIRYYQSDMQVPISVGDLILLSLYQKLETVSSAHQTYLPRMIVTGFEHDSEGPEGLITGIRGYVDGQYSFNHIKNIVRQEDGTPIAIERKSNSGIEITPLADAYKEITVPLTNINRLDMTRFDAVSAPFKQYERPQSWRRAPFDYSPAWTPAPGHSTVRYQDSGEYMLAIGRSGPTHQAPIATGDEVLFQVNTPGSFLGFRYDRILVQSIVMENGVATGVQGYNIGQWGRTRTWLFRDIEQHRSYIEDKPWAGKRANSMPGAHAKRTPYQRPAGFKDLFDDLYDSFFGSKKSDSKPFEDLFGYRYMSPGQSVETPPWTEKPISYHEWLEQNRLVHMEEVRLPWGYWVLQASPDQSRAQIKSQYRKLSRQFHPDVSGDTEAMAAINDAFDVVTRFHQ